DVERQIFRERDARIKRHFAGIQTIELVACGGLHASGERAERGGLHQFLQRGGRKVGAISARRQDARLARENRQPCRRFFELAGEYGIAPCVACVVALYCAAACVIERPAEIEVLDFVPSAAAERRRETARHRSARIEADEVETARAFRDDERQC